MKDQHSDDSNTETDDGNLGSSVVPERQEDQKKSVRENGKPGNGQNDTNNISDVLAFQDTLRKVWHRIKSPDFQGVAMGIGTIAIAFFTAATWIVILTGSGDTKKAANAADRFATTADLIRQNLSQAVSDNKTALDDNRQAIEKTLAENRAELAKVLSQNRQSLEAGTVQSKAALDATIDNFRQEQRAWVGFTGFSVQGDQINVGMNVATAALLNSGRTPAREVIAVVGFSFKKPSHILDKNDEDWISSAVDSIESGRTQPNPQSIKFSQGNMKASYSLSYPPLGNIDFEKISLGVIPPNVPVGYQHPTNWFVIGNPPDEVIVFGRVTYTDISKKRRFTSFCSYRAQIRDTNLRVCPIFNDMQ